MLADRVVALCEKLRDRLEDYLLDDALDYVDNNEWGVAFEILCDFLVDHDMRLSMGDYDEIVSVGMGMGFNSDDIYFKYLRPLVLRGGG